MRVRSRARTPWVHTGTVRPCSALSVPRPHSSASRLLPRMPSRSPRWCPQQAAASFFWCLVAASWPLASCLWPFAHDSKEVARNAVVAAPRASSHVGQMLAGNSINRSRPTFTLPNPMLHLKGNIKQRCDAALRLLDRVHSQKAWFSQFKQDSILWKQHYSKQCSQRKRVYLDVGVRTPTAAARFRSCAH